MLVLLTGAPLFMLEIGLLRWMTWEMIVYGVAYLAILVLFTCLANHRRRVIVVFAITLLLFQLALFPEYGVSFRLVQTLLFLLLVCMIILITESVRQNIPLMFSSDGGTRGWLRLFGETLLTWIWIPIFLVPLSIWVSSASFEWLERQFYTQLPISKHCQFNQRQAFDCTYMKSVRPGLRGEPLSSRKQLFQAVEQAFYHRQTSVLNTIDRTNPGKTVNVVSKYNLIATTILSFNGKAFKQIQTLERKITTYEQEKAILNGELSQYRKRLNNCRTKFGQMPSCIAKWNNKILLHNRVVNALRQNITQFKAQLHQKTRKLSKYQVTIYKALSNVEVSSNTITQQGRETAELRAKHAVETGAVLHKLLSSINRELEIMIRNNVFSKERRPPAKILLETIFPKWNPMCLYGRGGATAGGEHRLELPCDLFNKSNFQQRITEYDLDQNVKQTLISHTDRARARIEAQFGLSAVDLQEGKKNTNQISADFANNIFKPIDFDIPSCKFWQLKCKAERWVKIPISGLVNGGIVIAKSSFTKGARATIAQGNKSGEESLVLMRSNSINQLTTLEQSMATQVASKVAWVQSAVLAILMLSFLQIVIRSFFSILGAKLFDQQHGLTANGLPSREAALSEHTFEGSIEFKTQISIPTHFTEPIISKTPLDNQAFKRNLIPMQPTTAFFARLRRGWYAQLCNGSHDEGGQPMAIRSQEGRELIECYLREGDELVIDFARIIAMSKNIKLRTHISLRLSTITMGKSIFHCAYCESGEGLIIMEAQGHAIVLGSDATTPVERIVTWSSNTLFQTSRSSSSAVYKDGYNLRPIAATDRFIVIADSARTTAVPLWAWVKRFIRMVMPF